MTHHFCSSWLRLFGGVYSQVPVPLFSEGQLSNHTRFVFFVTLLLINISHKLFNFPRKSLKTIITVSALYDRFWSVLLFMLIRIGVFSYFWFSMQNIWRYFLSWLPSMIPSYSTIFMTLDLFPRYDLTYISSKSIKWSLTELNCHNAVVLEKNMLISQLHKVLEQEKNHRPSPKNKTKL